MGNPSSQGLKKSRGRRKVQVQPDDEGPRGTPRRRTVRERSQVGAEAESSRSLLKAALDSTADGLLVVDRKGRISLFNRKFKELFNIPEAAPLDQADEKAVRHVMDQLIDSEVFLARVKELDAHPEMESFDTLEFKDGRVIERASQPQYLGDEITGRVWNFRDITARRQAETALNKSEAELRALVEQIPAIVYTESAADPGITIYISPQIEAMTGYTPAEWMCSRYFWRKITYPADLAELVAEDDRTSACGEPFRTEYRIIKKDGSIRWIRDEAVLIHDGNGQALFWQGIMHDISDKKQAEEALAKSEAEMRALLAAMPDLVMVIDKDGRYIKIAPTAPDLLYKPPEQLLGKTLADVFPPAEARDFLGCIRGALRKNRTIHTEYALTIGGQDIWFSASISPMSSDQVVWTARDITERKRAELDLQKRNEELARLYRASGSLIAGAALNVQEQAQKIVEVLLQEFGQDNCSLFIIRRDSNELLRLAAAGPYAAQVRNTQLTLDGNGLVVRAMRTGHSLNSPDVNAEPDYVPSWDAARSELAIPLKIGEHVIGAIDLQSSQLNAFTSDDERPMTIFAERAALFLEHSRLNTQMEARIQQLVALRTVDMAISGSFDLNLTLGVLLDQLILILGVHAADILIFNSATQTFRFSSERGFRVQTLRHVQLKYGSGFVWRAVRERQVIIVPDLNEGPDGLQRIPDLSPEHFLAYIGIPLMAKGQVKGILEIYQREPVHFEPEMYSFLDILSGQAAIAIDNAELFESLQSSNSELSLAYEKTLEGWASALELRDHETEGHTRRATELTIRLARAMGVSDNEILHIYRGALLHDIGKMGVPDSIMRKPGPLTDDEWVSMRKHPLYAYDLLSPITYLRLALDIPYCHHERWDGSGYPRGLRGDQIPLAARIFAVVDVWDALISKRPYRDEWEPEAARKYIHDQAGMQFDPAVVKVFLSEINQSMN